MINFIRSQYRSHCQIYFKELVVKGGQLFKNSYHCLLLGAVRKIRNAGGEGIRYFVTMRYEKYGGWGV